MSPRYGHWMTNMQSTADATNFTGKAKRYKKRVEYGEDILTAPGHHMRHASLEADPAKCAKTKQNFISENIRQQCLQFLKDKLFSKLTSGTPHSLCFSQERQISVFSFHHLITIEQGILLQLTMTNRSER